MTSSLCISKLNALVVAGSMGSKKLTIIILVTNNRERSDENIYLAPKNGQFYSYGRRLKL